MDADSPAAPTAPVADGPKKRGRPRKTASHPETPAATTEPKRRGRRPNPRSVITPVKKKKRGRPPTSTPLVDHASVYIIPHAKQLKSDILLNSPGAAAIVIPKSLLAEKAGKSSIVIFPNVMQSLIDASTGKRKPGRPRSVHIKEKPLLPSKVGKRKPGRPRKKAVVLNKELVGSGGQAPTAKGPGRPWKIRDMLVRGNAHAVLANGEEIAAVNLVPEILKKAEKLGTPESIHGTEDATNLNVKKRPVGRPRKYPLIEGFNPPAV